MEVIVRSFFVEFIVSICIVVTGISLVGAFVMSEPLWIIGSFMAILVEIFIMCGELID